MAARFLAYKPHVLVTGPFSLEAADSKPIRVRREERSHTRRMATLSASPFTGAPAEPAASFFARIGLSFFEFAPEAGDEDSRRFGRIRMAEGGARGRLATVVLVLVPVGEGGPEEGATYG